MNMAAWHGHAGWKTVLPLSVRRKLSKEIVHCFCLQLQARKTWISFASKSKCTNVSLFLRSRSSSNNAERQGVAFFAKTSNVLSFIILLNWENDWAVQIFSSKLVEWYRRFLRAGLFCNCMVENATLSCRVNTNRLCVVVMLVLILEIFTIEHYCIVL